jgi:hypothetical protein
MTFEEWYEENKELFDPDGEKRLTPTAAALRAWNAATAEAEKRAKEREAEAILIEIGLAATIAASRGEHVTLKYLTERQDSIRAKIEANRLAARSPEARGEGR